MVDVLVPRESINDDTVILKKLHVASGSLVTSEQVVLEIETSKTIVEVLSPLAGLVAYGLEEGQELPVGSLLFTVTEPENASVNETPLQIRRSLGGKDGPVEAVHRVDDAPVLSNAAAEIANSADLKLDEFRGRWVTSADLKPRPSSAVNRDVVSSAPDGTTMAARGVVASAPESLPHLAFEEIRQTKRKRAEVDSLLRGRHGETTSTIGVRIQIPGGRIVPASFLFRESISDLLIFEGARLLRQYQDLNAFEIDEKRVGYYRPVNFGVSFDNVNNLKVLTLASADTLSLSQVQQGISDLLDLFESNKPIPAELLGTSTVTITDLSATEASFMLPLLNGQQSLILGVLKRDIGQFEVFASFDHRVSEGLRVVRFLEELRVRVQSHYFGSDGQVSLICAVCGKSIQDEVRLGNRGFLNLTLPTGASALFCRNCFEGR